MYNQLDDLWKYEILMIEIYLRVIVIVNLEKPLKKLSRGFAEVLKPLITRKTHTYIVLDYRNLPF